VIEPRPVADERLRPGRVLPDVFVGAGAGFVAGGLTAAGTLLWEGDAFRWAGTLVALGGLAWIAVIVMVFDVVDAISQLTTFVLAIVIGTATGLLQKIVGRSLR